MYVSECGRIDVTVATLPHFVYARSQNVYARVEVLLQYLRPVSRRADVGIVHSFFFVYVYVFVRMLSNMT